jgi:hypothetical protein
MAFRIPYLLLTEAHKTVISKDLILKEKTGTQFWQKNNKYSKVKGKEITFYSVDKSTNDLLLPMYYASNLFGIPIINKRRIFHKITPFKLTATLRDYQVEVVNTSIKNFMKTGSTFLNVFCSFGKTVVAAYFSAMLSQQYGLVTLVVYPRRMIESSWIGTFKTRTDAKIYVVGETQGPPDEDVQVFLCMDGRLSDIDPIIRSRIGHYVIDEADCFCTAGKVDCLLAVEPMIITVLTATYERDDGFETMLDLLAGPERITKISTKPFFVFQRPTEFEVNPKVGPRGIVFDDLVKQLDDIEARNSMILQTVLDNFSEKILVLTKHVEHAENLHTWLSYYLQGHGKTVSLLAKMIKKYDDASIVIGTISKVGRGFDEKESCHDWRGERINMLILASPTKKIEQIAGRVFRADVPIIVDIVDNHKNTKAHWTIRKKWYESRNGMIYQMKGPFIWSTLKDAMMEQYIANLNGIKIQPTIELPGECVDIDNDPITKSHAQSATAMIRGFKTGHTIIQPQPLIQTAYNPVMMPNNNVVVSNDIAKSHAQSAAAMMRQLQSKK